jgi:hypothetical protein
MILMSPTITKSQVHTEADGALVPDEPLSEIVKPEPQELGPEWTRRYRAYVRKLARWQQLGEELETMKDQFRTLGIGRYTINGRPELDIILTRRWSEEQARAVLPAEVARAAEITIIDRHRIKDPWYSLCQEVRGKPAVRRVQRRSP